MKKRMVFIISVSMALVMLAACGGPNTVAATTTAGSAATTAEATVTTTAGAVETTAESAAAVTSASPVTTTAAATVAETTAENAASDGAPVQTAPVKYYRRAINQNDSVPDNNIILAHIQELTGIELEVYAIPQDSYRERMDLMIASSEHFDGMDLLDYSNTYRELMIKGAILPLNDLLDQYAPNVKSMMEPALYCATDSEGVIWSIPRRDRFSIGYVPTIRGDWLEALNMPMPTTIEELELFFEAVQTNDLTGSGTTDDQIPFLPYTLAYGLSNFVHYFMNGYDNNISSRGYMNFNNIKELHYMDDDGYTIRSIITHPNYIKLLETFHRWYERGFIPADIHLLKTAQLVDLRFTGGLGFLAGWYTDGNAAIHAWNQANPDKTPGRYDPVPPLQNAPGRSMWPANAPYSPLIVFMRTAENPEALMRYIEWTLSDSSNMAIAYYGIEGMHWNWVPELENTVAVTELGTTNYRSFYAFPSAWFPGFMPDTYAPPEVPIEYMRNNQEKIISSWNAAAAPFDAHIPYEYIGNDAEFLTADGPTLIEESIIRIIIGELPLSEWDRVVQQYNAIEGDILSAVWTEQYWAFVGGR